MRTKFHIVRKYSEEDEKRIKEEYNGVKSYGLDITLFGPIDEQIYFLNSIKTIYDFKEVKD